MVARIPEDPQKGEWSRVFERLLLNVLVSMAPAVAYQLFMSHSLHPRDSKTAQILVGVLAGLSSVVCMVYPVVSGTNFLWDLRWIPFLFAVSYGRVIGGVICAVLMLGYRYHLGGFVSWLEVVIDAAVLFAVVLWFEPRVREKWRLRKILFTSALISGVTYVFVMATIFLYFVYEHDAHFFLEQGAWFYIGYGVLTVGAYLASVAVIENFFKQQLMRRELENSEKLHLISDMAASFAHEIRNPLTVVKGFIQLETEDTASDLRRNRLALASAEIQRAEGIIGEYLSFAKPEVPDVEVVSLAEILHQVHDIISPFATMHLVEVHLQCNALLRIHVDPTKFKQLMLNLVKNSIEAIPAGGNVHIRGYQGNGKVCIEVEDDGVGMSQGQLHRLGTPFYSTKDKGTGLGLMVTFQLVEAMQGTIEFTSESGRGTKALLQFPAQSPIH